MMSDFSAEVVLYESDNNGRDGPTPPDKWGCLLVVDEQYFDCRMLLHGTPLAPGERRLVQVKLLDPDNALGRFTPGRRFTVFDGRIVGEGKVIGA
jgi:hypothetical protein